MCFAFSTGDRTIQNSYDDSHWGRFWIWHVSNLQNQPQWDIFMPCQSGTPQWHRDSSDLQLAAVEVLLQFFRGKSLRQQKVDLVRGAAEGARHRFQFLNVY